MIWEIEIYQFKDIEFVDLDANKPWFFIHFGAKPAFAGVRPGDLPVNRGLNLLKANL